MQAVLPLPSHLYIHSFHDIGVMLLRFRDMADPMLHRASRKYTGSQAAKV
jgi:hypothetical protein